MSSVGRMTKTKSGTTKKLKTGDGLKVCGVEKTVIIIPTDVEYNFQDIRTIIDSNILSENIGKSLSANLTANGISCETNETTKGFIKWQRINQQIFVQNNDNVSGGCGIDYRQ